MEGMYSGYQDQEELEDDLYQENGDSDASEVNSEVEFHLYSQLHYSSNAGEMEELGDRGEEAECQGSQKLEVTTRSADGDREQELTRQNSLQSPNIIDQQLNEKRGSKCHKRKMSSIPPSFEEVIVIDSSPDVISISDGSTSSDDIGVCALKSQDPQRLQTSTPAQQVTTELSVVIGNPVMLSVNALCVCCLRSGGRVTCFIFGINSFLFSKKEHMKFVHCGKILYLIYFCKSETKATCPRQRIDLTVVEIE